MAWLLTWVAACFLRLATFLLTVDMSIFAFAWTMTSLSACVATTFESLTTY